jgi:hypothetical protein
MNAPKLTEDELRRHGQSWFAESRELSSQDDAEVAAWKKELRKWTTYSNEGFFSFYDSSDSSGGDGGGGGGGGDD